MHKLISKLSKIIGKGRVFKLFFNISPMYRRSGGRLIKVSNDLKYVKIKLPLNYKTRNYVGTLYGGHMYSCVDGIYMVQLINILSKKYVIWDKSATIKFKKPGDKTLYAEFILTDEFLEQIQYEVNELREKDYALKVNLVDKTGAVYAEVEKIIYVALKSHYKAKRKLK